MPSSIHQMWKEGGAKREELAAVFAEVGENKDPHLSSFGDGFCFLCVCCMLLCLVIVIS